MLDIRTVVAVLGGHVTGRDTASCPGPGHSRQDRSLSIKLDPDAPQGFFAYSHCGDDWRDCRQYVAERLGLPAWKPGDGQNRAISPWRTRQFDEAAIKRKAAERQQRTEDQKARIARAVALWNEGRDPRGTLAQTYLNQHRYVDLPGAYAGSVLRFHPRCPWRDENTGQTIYAPCLLAPFRDIDSDEIVGIQRVALTPNGAKIGRRMLGAVAHAAIKFDAVNERLCVGEGLESSLAGRALGYEPVWALGSVGAIGRLPVIKDVKQLVVFGESGEASADAIKLVATRWHHAGRRVRIIKPVAGSDLNDVVVARHEATA